MWRSLPPLTQPELTDQKSGTAPSLAMASCFLACLRTCASKYQASLTMGPRQKQPHPSNRELDGPKPIPPEGRPKVGPNSTKVVSKSSLQKSVAHTDRTSVGTKRTGPKLHGRIGPWSIPKLTQSRPKLFRNRLEVGPI